VIGDHVIDSSEHSGYSAMVKMTSMMLLNVVAKAQGLERVDGDVGNAYLNTETKEKFFTKCSLEFGPEMVNRIAIVQKGLFGLKSIGNRWYSHVAKTIHQLGFTPSRYDPNIWYKLRDNGEGYDYIATYVDDFLITAKDAWSCMRHLQSVYTIKEPMHPEIYLGALYTSQPSQDWSISCKN